MRRRLTSEIYRCIEPHDGHVVVEGVVGIVQRVPGHARGPPEGGEGHSSRHMQLRFIIEHQIGVKGTQSPV